MNLLHLYKVNSVFFGKNGKFAVYKVHSVFFKEKIGNFALYKVHSVFFRDKNLETWLFIKYTRSFSGTNVEDSFSITYRLIEKIRPLLGTRPVVNAEMEKIDSEVNFNFRSPQCLNSLLLFVKKLWTRLSRQPWLKASNSSGVSFTRLLPLKTAEKEWLLLPKNEKQISKTNKNQLLKNWPKAWKYLLFW